MRVADVRGWGHLTGGGACRFSETKAADIQVATAHLIAAAPDLLEMLKQTQVDVCAENCMSYEHVELCTNALAVIAKAEGR